MNINYNNINYDMTYFFSNDYCDDNYIDNLIVLNNNEDYIKKIYSFKHIHNINKSVIWIHTFIKKIKKIISNNHGGIYINHSVLNIKPHILQSFLASIMSINKLKYNLKKINNKLYHHIYI